MGTGLQKTLDIVDDGLKPQGSPANRPRNMTTTRPSPQPPGNDFQALLGDASRPGLLPLKERLKQIEKGVNPYVTGDALPANSPVFFGRDQALHETLSVLCRPDKPGCVSVVAERRMWR